MSPFQYKLEHKTFVGTVDKLGQIIISIKQEVCQPGDVQIFRAIMRSKPVADTRLIIPVADIPPSAVIRNKGALKAVLSMLHPHVQSSRLKKIQFDSLAKKLIALDELQLIMRYKFGVLYCKDGQKTEEEMYNNGGCSAIDLSFDTIGEGFDSFSPLNIRNGF